MSSALAQLGLWDRVEVLFYCALPGVLGRGGKAFFIWLLSADAISQCLSLS